MEELIEQLQNASAYKEEIVFVKFNYVELRDLMKHFLTLISATLVFSLTFSEKILDFQKAPLTQKLFLYASWSALVLAIAFCGYALNKNYEAANIAVKRMNEMSNLSFQNTAAISASFQQIAAILYGIGITLLISTSLFKLKKTTKS